MMIEVNFSNNINFYKEINNNDFFIPELNVRLKVLGYYHSEVL